jgi:hypothetical protein
MFVEDMDIDGADVEHAVSKTSLQEKALEQERHNLAGWRYRPAFNHFFHARQLYH